MKIYKHPKVFLDLSTEEVINLIFGIKSIGKKINTILVCKMMRENPDTSEVEYVIPHFRSNTHSIVSHEGLEESYETMKGKILESISTYLALGSGWRFVNVEYLDIYISKYKPLAGKSYKPLPSVVEQKKAIINMKNTDNMCFKWAVTRALNPTERENKNPGLINNTLKEQAEELNWEGIVFPVNIDKIETFEKNNSIGINVFSFDDNIVYTLRLSKSQSKNIVNLFYYDEHYSVVKDLSRLVSSQISLKKNYKLFCLRCLEHFGSQKLLDEHSEYCINFDHQKTLYPQEEKNNVYFKNIHKIQKIPFAVYADFECFLNPYDKSLGKGTTQYQKHNPSRFIYTIKCCNENIYKNRTRLYTMEKEGEDISKKFVECLEEDLREVYDIMKKIIPINMTKMRGILRKLKNVMYVNILFVEIKLETTVI